MPAEPAQPLVRLDDVGRVYPLGTRSVHALRAVDLTIAAGESVAVVGRSGSGKSTLLHLLTGIDRPTSGTVHVGGAALHALSENALTAWRGRHVGIVFQAFQLLPTLSVLDNVLLAMDFVGTVPTRARHGRAMTLLDRVGLADHASKAPGALSGGEQQRAAVARALANDPPLLVADEPTGNLDSATGEMIVALLLELVGDGRTLVVVTHDATVASRMSRIVTLHDGAVVTEDAGGGVRLTRKVVADLAAARGRAALVVLAMATGLFAVVSVAVTNAILTRELRRSFAAIAPASAIVRTTSAPADALAAAARRADVRALVVGRTITGRTHVDGNGVPVIVSTFADYDAITVNRLRAQTGTFPPPDDAIVIERAALRVAGARIGDTIRVAVGERTPVALRVAGTVHDFSFAPAWQEGVVYAYVSRATMARLVGDDGLSDVRLIVRDQPNDVAHIRAVAGGVADALERSGVRVRDLEIPPPGRHPHQDQMNGLLGMQQAFGTAALLLSGAIVVVLLGAMLAQHRRQIGILKAIGATRGTIVRMYLMWLAAMAATAEMIALPAGILAGRAYARFVADMLNFDVADASVPTSLVVTLVALGAAIPALLALAPILRAARATTRSALADVAAARGAGRTPWFTRRSQGARLRALAIANALRAPGRFALVAATLAVGGALFLSALNLGRSIQQTLAVSYARLGYDVVFGVGDAMTVEETLRVARSVAGVASAEGSLRVRAVAGDSVDPSPNGFTIQGTTATRVEGALSSLVGRWLAPDDARAVVANHVWMRAHPGHAPGDSITLRVGGVSSRWLLAGEVREVMGGPTLYARQAIVDSVSAGRGRAISVRVTVDDRADDAVRDVMRRIERALLDRGVAVSFMQSVQTTRQHREDHMVMIIGFLVAMATLSLVVGGLGLATALGVGVVERGQELGAMRAMGAAPRHLLSLVLTEGVWTATVGWAGSVLLAVPATIVLDRVFGRMMLGAVLDVHFSPTAVPALAAVLALVAVGASALPAWRASQLEPRVLLTSP